jgi:hypothetical protein
MTHAEELSTRLLIVVSLLLIGVCWDLFRNVHFTQVCPAVTPVKSYQAASTGKQMHARVHAPTHAQKHTAYFQH